MSKAIEGAAMLAAAVGMGVVAYFDPMILFTPGYAELMASLAMGGLAMEAGAIANALTQNRATNITTRQPASFRQIIYGEQRVGGVMVYESTTGSKLDQYNMIIVLATHEIDSIKNLYLDGRQVHWSGNNTDGNVTRNGVNFGGNATGGTFIGPGGQHYNFDGLVYCEARFGDQADGDVISGMTANDPNWSSTANGAPWLGGCAYVYLKVEYDASMFPSLPEIKFTIRGKNNIIDPRQTITLATPPTVLATPTVLTNGWAGNAQDAAYEEGVDQGYGWGLNPEATPGYSNPSAAYDGNLSTAASIVFRGTHQYAGCIWSFPALTSEPTSLWLNVNSMVNPYSNTGRSAGIWFSLDGGTSWTQIYNSPNHAQTWDAVELSPTQDTSQVQVMAFTDAHDDMGHFVYEIQLATAAQVNASDASNGGIYTTNWALIISDILTDTTWGLGDVGAVNQDQLIAAANVCDEQVDLAAGGTETRYTANWHYDTSVSPGDALQTFMNAAAGRISRIGGEWFIWPAYWTGPTFTFDESALSGKVEWKPYRKFRDLINCINGTYIAANFPYNVAGDLYDSNGWYDGTIQNNFPFAFQPTNYPQYAVDMLHGYSTNVYLNQDNGVVLPKEVSQQCVLSVAQAQRCAKIILMRNRQQGTGTLMMNLNAWQMQPIDTFFMNFAPQNWSSKILEVVSTQFSVDTGDGDTKPSTIRFQCGVQETSTAVYEWNPDTEELSVYDVPANPQVGPGYVVPAPSDLVLASSSVTALHNADGSITPQILATWTAPADASVTQINIQYQLAGASSWTNAPSVSGSTTSTYISGVIAGQTYNVQIQAQRANGATSVWVEASVVAWGPSSLGILLTNAAGVDIALGTSLITVLPT